MYIYIYYIYIYIYIYHLLYTCIYSTNTYIFFRFIMSLFPCLQGLDIFHECHFSTPHDP